MCEEELADIEARADEALDMIGCTQVASDCIQLAAEVCRLQNSLAVVTAVAKEFDIWYQYARLRYEKADVRIAELEQQQVSKKVTASSSVYAIEISLFEQHLQQWLDEGKEGQWVVINGDDILGFFAESADAYRAAVDRYGKGTRWFKRLIQKDLPQLVLPIVTTRVEYDKP